MTDVELLKLWKAVEGRLESARQALPSPSAADADACRVLLARYHEYLAHNELELSLDALEELGDRVGCRAAFWRDLERAAELMELEDRLPGLRNKIGQAPD